MSRKGHNKLLILSRVSTLKPKMSSDIKIPKPPAFRADFTQCAGSHCAILSDGTKEKTRHKMSTIIMLQM